jgi:hypothetical protein
MPERARSMPIRAARPILVETCAPASEFELHARRGLWREAKECGKVTEMVKDMVRGTRGKPEK